MPKLGLTMTEGTVAKWLVEEGQRVEKGQILFEAETDKITTEVQAEAGGIVCVTAPEGTLVPVLGVVGYLLQDGEKRPEAEVPVVEAPPPAPALPAHPAPSEVATVRLASPAAKRRAKELGVDIGQVIPSSPDGRISAADVEAFATQPKLKLESDALPMSAVRRVIAERMLASSQRTAPVTLTTEVDATEMAAAKAGLSERLGRRISYNDLLVKCAAAALTEHTDLNARLVGETIVRSSGIHIGIAVDTPRGLMVPVIRSVAGKSLAEVSLAVREAAERAMAGRSLPDELSGGTFTITNLGALGVDAFTPIVNLPEVAILGVGRIQPKPTVWRGSIVIRERLVLSLTVDHRLIDGAPAARFLGRIAELIETGAGWAGEQ
jgi:pyruvate dehydrogenase E2 component (dihydrolipoamide acetyltransferase)